MTRAFPGDVSTGETLLLHADRLALARRTRETAIVRAARTTTVRDEDVQEPLTREEIVVERVPVNRTVDAVPEARQEGDTMVYPVVEEIVVLERRLVLKEEVRVRRVRTTQMYIETVSLRSQDLVVTRTEIEAPAAGAEMADMRPSRSLPTQPPPEGTSPMDGETIVAVYDTPAHAALAVADLKQAGIPDSAISMHSGEATTTTTAIGAPVREEGFWASLFGGEPDHDTAVYDRSMSGGSTVVTVKGSATYSSKAAEILESHHPVDMDERAAGYGLVEPTMTETTTRQPVVGTVPATAATDGGTIQLSEERLSVGKRVVNRGGTRIRRFVVETPVEEQVTLHDEKVTLERRPVMDGRPVTNADFTDKTIEMTETAEEVVVAKQAFVTEEIALKKTATDRVETVRDTVRKEDVEIVNIPGETVTKTTTGPVTPVATGQDLAIHPVPGRWTPRDLPGALPCPPTFTPTQPDDRMGCWRPPRPSPEPVRTPAGGFPGPPSSAGSS